MSERLAVALAVLGSALAAIGCTQRPCTEAGCTSGISVKVVGVFPGGAALVRACLDGECAEAPWPVRDLSCEEVEEGWSLSVCLQDDGSFIRLALADDAGARDGVTFDLVIEDAEGEALLHESESVRFSDSYPNGKGCPGHCKYANYRY